jgi:hypothetical protein
MKRSLFVTGLSVLAIAAVSRAAQSAPRIAGMQTMSGVTRVRRRVATRKVATPGRCSDLRRVARWSSYTANDFA